MKIISATALAGEGVFWDIVAWTGLFSVHLRDPRRAFLNFPGPSVFGVFLVLFSKSLF